MFHETCAQDFQNYALRHVHKVIRNVAYMWTEL